MSLANQQQPRVLRDHHSFEPSLVLHAHRSCWHCCCGWYLTQSVLSSGPTVFRQRISQQIPTENCQTSAAKILPLPLLYLTHCWPSEKNFFFRFSSQAITTMQEDWNVSSATEMLQPAATGADTHWKHVNKHEHIQSIVQQRSLFTENPPHMATCVAWLKIPCLQKNVGPARSTSL